MKLSTLQWDALKAGDTLLPAAPTVLRGQTASAQRSSWRTAFTLGAIAVGSIVGGTSLGLLTAGTSSESGPPFSLPGDVNLVPSTGSVVAYAAEGIAPASASTGVIKEPFVRPHRLLVELSDLPTVPAGETPALWRELRKRNR